MITALYIYLLGVLLAYVLLVYALKRISRKNPFMYVPAERIQLASLLSWIYVAGFAAAYLLHALTLCYVWVLFRYMLWKQNRKNKLQNHIEDG